MPAPLLATKYYCPPLTRNLVPRPRLLELLEGDFYPAGDFTRRLTLISAPAGYGKTTLVAAWLNKWEQGRGEHTTERVRHVAWLSLDEGDNDPTLFLAYVIGALQGISQDIGAAVLSALQSPQPSGVELLLTTLINDLVTVAAPILLVLDDYHVIHTPAIHRQLSFLLEHLPPHVHLVIMTREDPLLPIALLRARGQVLEIRQDDLRFTSAECAEFLQRMMGLTLSTREIASLERRTEGWIAGLQLAALSMRGRSDLPTFIQAFTGSSRFVLDYLIEEVFERQTPEVQDFLLKTSLLERFSAPLCVAVTDRTTSQEILETLEQANLFIVPLDQSRVWYRYHRLFAELLRHRLRTFHPDLEGELHLRASRWFEAEGQGAEAIQHALSAKDWGRAGNLIHQFATDFFKRGEVLTVVGWFQALPEAMLSSDPRLGFDYCWALLLANQFDLVAPLLERLEQVAQEVPTFLGEIYAAQAYLARGTGDHARMVERSQRALGLLPKSSVNSRGIVAVNLGLAYWHMGRMQEAEEVLGEAWEAGQATGNHYASLTALIFQGRVLAVRGKLHQALEFFTRAIQLGKDMPINALAHMDLATLHYEWNALEVSDTHLQKAIALNQQAQNEEFEIGCWMLASRLRMAQGNLAGAEEALGQAWTLAQGSIISPQMVARMEVAQARFLMKKGELSAEWSQKLTDQADCHPFYRFLGLTRARILPEPEARAYLKRLGQQAEANGWSYGLIAIRALQAVLAITRGEGQAFLTEALQLAADEGFIRTFVEVGEGLVPLLRSAVGQGVYAQPAAQILEVLLERSGEEQSGSSALVEPLSARELEVLRLITVGMSNREIAEELVISPGTAKTHVHNVCGKLGARNRTEAAMKAKELGLI